MADGVDILGGAVGRIVLADNLVVLASLPDDSIDLVYIDPPFNTGKRQTLRRLKTVPDPEGGDRTGFGGRRYRTIELGEPELPRRPRRLPRFARAAAGRDPARPASDRQPLPPPGSREVHYAKVLCDAVFGRECFLNEVIWAYDYGARTKRRWPAKHDDILVYVKDPERYWFDAEAVERIPYMAPGLVGPEKAARGKLPTDTWWQTIVPPGGSERTGYPTQKPVAVLRRVVSASCPPGGVVADFFAGSGTTGAAALELGRRFLLVDSNPRGGGGHEAAVGGSDGRGGRGGVAVGAAAHAPSPADSGPPRPRSSATGEGRRRDLHGRLGNGFAREEPDREIATTPKAVTLFPGLGGG